MVRLVVFILIAVFAISVLRLVIGVLLKGVGGLVQPDAPEQAGRRPGGGSPGGELKRDPVCGTYVAAASAVTKREGGEVLYFCSEACRRKYSAGNA